MVWSCPTCPQRHAVLRAVKDASRRFAVASGPSLTALARGVCEEDRSAPGNGPDSLTRKWPVGDTAPPTDET